MTIPLSSSGEGSSPAVGVGVGVGAGCVGVAVGGTDVAVGATGVGVAVGGTVVGVAVGGTSVGVAVGVDVAVGATGVAVGTTGVAVGGTGVGVSGTGVGGTGVGIDVGGTGGAVGSSPGVGVAAARADADGLAPARAGPPRSRASGSPALLARMLGSRRDYSIVTAQNLPAHGPFQDLEMDAADHCGSGLKTAYGPGDQGYVGGRWLAPDGSRFLCPLLGPGYLPAD